MTELETIVDPLEHAKARQRYLLEVRAAADALAAKLVEATEAGVSGGVILPQLIASFKKAFGGDMPPEVLALVAAARARQ